MRKVLTAICAILLFLGLLAIPLSGIAFAQQSQGDEQSMSDQDQSSDEFVEPEAQQEDQTESG